MLRWVGSGAMSVGCCSRFCFFGVASFSTFKSRLFHVRASDCFEASRPKQGITRSCALEKRYPVLGSKSKLLLKHPILAKVSPGKRFRRTLIFSNMFEGDRSPVPHLLLHLSSIRTVAFPGLRWTGFGAGRYGGPGCRSTINDGGECLTLVSVARAPPPHTHTRTEYLTFLPPPIRTTPVDPPSSIFRVTFSKVPYLRGVCFLFLVYLPNVIIS